MMIYFVISIYIATFLTQEAIAAGENEIKRGVFPFMAVIYYPDSEIMDDMGTRFQRGGILIHENWLISSSIEGKDDSQDGFPKKTLIARLGAIHLDANFTYNEDEDEQEREIIQVVKPAYHNRQTWWKTDINLLKALLPFNMSAAVATSKFHSRKESKNCIILVYSRLFNNSNDDKLLMKLGVAFLPPTTEECGGRFEGTSMICATQSEENKNLFHDANFCQGNRGAPLLCDGDIVGIQTYVDDCNQPYLYQLLSSWEELVTCGMDDSCGSGKCTNICEAVYKDEPQSSKKPATHPTYFVDSEFKNISKMPLQILSRSNDNYPPLSSPTPTVPEVTTSTTEMHDTETPWQSSYSDKSSLSDVHDSVYNSQAQSSSTEAEDSAGSVPELTLFSADTAVGQNTAVVSETYEQSMDPIEESSVTVSESAESIDTSILRSSSELQDEPTPTEGSIAKLEEETIAPAEKTEQSVEPSVNNAEDMKVIDNRRKSQSRGEGKDRRGKVEAQLQLPLPQPKGKSNGARRIISNSGAIIIATLISFV